MNLPFAGTASPFMWLPFVGYLVAVAAAILAVWRESGSEPSVDRADDHSDER